MKMLSKTLLILVIAIVACTVVEAGLKDRLAPARTLTVNTAPHIFTAKLQRLQLKPKEITILWFGFTTWGFPRFRVQFFENEEKGNSRFKFRFGLLHIAEYNDTTPDFQRANVIPGRGIRLIGRGPDWTDMVYTGPDAITGVRTCMTQLVDPKGTVKITAKVAPRAVVDGNATLAPNKIKFDLAIENFQYQYPTSKIAVLAVMTMKAAFNPKDNKGSQSSINDDNADEVTVKSDTTVDGGRFAWVRDAFDTTRGQVVKVKSFPLRDDDSDYTGANSGKGGDVGDDDKDSNEVGKLVVFVFDTNGQPTSLLWDPEVAVDDNASIRLTGSFLIVVLAVLASFFW
jgi:hypothetical protein